MSNALQTKRQEEPLQGRLELSHGKASTAGLPDTLKAGIEYLSGISMDDVQVHYNSSKPAEIQALAYTEGTEIYVGPGQEKHLPHEAWHVVQQKQGRVTPTLQAKGIAINDDQDLEKEADVMGIKAAKLTVDSAATPRTSKLKSLPVTSLKSVVQRKVGFEFELEDLVATYQSGIFGYKPLSKRDRILEGEGFYVEADQLAGGRTSWEFVTEPFEETMPGLIKLMGALDRIASIISVMRNSTLSTLGNTVYNPVDNRFSNFAYPVGNRYFTITRQDFRTKPQVTAGLALEALDELFHSVSTAAGPEVSNLVRDTGAMSEFGKVAAPQLDAPLGNMRTAAGNAIGAAPNPALRGLVTQLMQFIIAGRQDIGATPKTVMRLALGRSDMKAAFNTLPPAIRNPFEANPATFVTLVMNAVNAYLGGAPLANNEPVISGRLFTDQQFAQDKVYNKPSPFTEVTRDQWLTNIATPGGQDMLSQGHYPVRKDFSSVDYVTYTDPTDIEANNFLGSMGALHNQVDPGNHAIFEIRNSKMLYAALITPYALDFFKYVLFLHTPGLTESRELIGMADNDVVEMVQFAPNRAVLVQQMQQRAVNNFNQ